MLTTLYWETIYQNEYSREEQSPKDLISPPVAALQTLTIRGQLNCFLSDRNHHHIITITTWTWDK